MWQNKIQIKETLIVQNFATYKRDRDRQTDRQRHRQTHTHTYTLTGRVREGETEADTHIPREGRGREQITVNSRVASQREAVGGTGGKGGGVYI